MDWAAQYSAALSERDAREKAHKPFFDAYSRLADLKASTASVEPATVAAIATSTSRAASIKRPATPKGREASPVETPLAQLRADLAATQKARSVLQTQNDELTAALKNLERDHRIAAAQAALVLQQKADVERRLRDREEEVRGKSMLAEAAQDEMVALSLQLNMSEQKCERLTRENKELVDRWMKRMGEEAEQLNRDSKWE